VTLTGNLGSSSLTIAQLFSSGPGFWTITGSVPPISLALVQQSRVAQLRTGGLADHRISKRRRQLSALRNDAVAPQKAVAAENAAEPS
jgi:hypothetical protein